MLQSRWLTWSIRGLAVMALIVCVFCKMVDLDCALTDPLHCQTLLESTDNSVSHVALDHSPSLPMVLGLLGLLLAVAPAPLLVMAALRPPLTLATGPPVRSVVHTFRRPPPRVSLAHL